VIRKQLLCLSWKRQQEEVRMALMMRRTMRMTDRVLLSRQQQQRLRQHRRIQKQQPLNCLCTQQAVVWLALAAVVAAAIEAVILAEGNRRRCVEDLTAEAHLVVRLAAARARERGGPSRAQQRQHHAPMHRSAFKKMTKKSAPRRWCQCHLRALATQGKRRCRLGRRNRRLLFRLLLLLLQH